MLPSCWVFNKSMDKAEGNRQGGSRGLENLSLQIGNFPRDLLQRFRPSACNNDDKNHSYTLDSHFSADHQEGSSEDIELSLGLSLGGRFGVDKHAKKLMRSSSVVGTTPLVREDELSTPPPFSYTTLIRTSSLPAETEEEWRKRKELQTRRRMEAKRRRSEKQRNSKVERENSVVGAVGSLEDEKREHVGQVGLNLKHQYNNTSIRSSGSGLPAWAARQMAVGSGVDVLAKVTGSGVFQRYAKPSSQVSLDSQGGSSSGMSEMESKLFQGSSSCEARSPASTQSLTEQSNQEAEGSSGATTTKNAMRSCRAEVENPSRKLELAARTGKEIGTNAMEDMPCVFTKGDGPDGRRVEGILYKYGKGEEVRIMCVCHGSFLSPAEFVKHAGGSDVAHPLRHIVMNPSSSPL